MSVVSLDHVGVTYRTRRTRTEALTDCSMSIGTGSLALLGPNGSGKSTLMGVLAGTLRPDTGAVERAPEADRVGMVFQTPALDALLTVRENLELAGRLHAMDTGAITTRIGELAQELGIADRLGTRVGRLSGGLARRVDLARALLPSPSLLLLDEPSAGLDPDARGALLGMLAGVASRGGVAIVLSTHLTEEAEHCDRVVMLDQGRVALEGTPGELRAGLGDRVVRITGSETDLERAHAWCDAEGLAPARVGGGLLITHADPDLVARCPVAGAGVTLAPPSLADVYRWRTRRALDRDTPRAETVA